MEDFGEFLRPGKIVDSDHPSVVETTKELLADCQDGPVEEKVRRLFDFTRDKIWFSTWEKIAAPEDMYASNVLRIRKGFCPHKGVLLTALARAAGIPARVGVMDMRNFRAAPRLIQMLGGNQFIGAAFSELYVNGKWLRFTPVFNVELCAKLGWPVVQFDGRNSAVFPPTLADGRPYIEVVKVYGVYQDWPFDFVRKIIWEHYGQGVMDEWRRQNEERNACLIGPRPE